MVQIKDYIDVNKKARDLGCNRPLSLTLLPRNFETATSKGELIHEGNAPTIRVLLRQNEISETKLEKEGEKFPCVQEKSFVEWIAPAIFISADLLQENSIIVSVIINIISNYLTDWLRGIPINSRKVRLSIVLETKNGNFKKVEYEGPQDGLKELPEVIKRVSDE
ncbi:hypothetical protein [Caldisericum sp.]|uniref:hypothetical protein n=1 Tax=Caldisericum sp. TaxID=2499687 RepID=UPI003D0BC983